MIDAMKTKSLAQEVTSWYLKKLDPRAPHDQNVRTILRSPVLHVTLRVLSPERQTAKEQDWGKWDLQAYEGLNARHKAKMEAFLQGCVLAVPVETSINSKGRKQESPHGVIKKTYNMKTRSNDEVPKTRTPKSPVLTSIQDTALMRSTSEEDYLHPQLQASDLCTRLGLYLSTLTMADESIKVCKARTLCIVRAFVATVGCVRSVGPTLRQLLENVTKEVVCVQWLSGEVVTVIKRVVSEYEHQVSFASLAFLSSPEDSAEQKLGPLVLSYLQYIKQNMESILQDCEMERLLTAVLNQKMRQVFKTVEFKSIGHLLEICQRFQYELHNIEIPPPGIAAGIRGGDQNPWDDSVVLKQAIRDLQREMLTVNGHVLPPVKSRKELVQLLTQTLNSRSLFRRRNRYDRRARSSSTRVALSESEGPVSSGNDGDHDWSGNEGQTQQPCSDATQKRGSHSRRQNFQLSTIDIMTRRLLVASSRTGNGGDAYFVVRDLFGGDDVEVVPSLDVNGLSSMSQRPLSLPLPLVAPHRTTSIEILVRLSCVIIKCHASFDVYPKSSVGDCEPLIQLHTTTTETIHLKEVRASDDDGLDKNPAHSYNHESSSDDEDSEYSKLILKEKITEKTGWRTISVRPAQYEAVGEWNTPS